MHEIQTKLLALAGRKDLSRLTLKEMAEMIGEKGMNPSLIQYHLERLEKRGLLFVDKKARKQTFAQDAKNLHMIPIVGTANCGPASVYAIEDVQGHLPLSKSVHLPHADKCVAVIASGDSMNNARVLTPAGAGLKASIRSGDYVIVDTSDKSMEQGYVLSVIDGMANIKRLVKRTYDIALISESTYEDLYPPIIITPEDDYMINGRVVMVCEG